MAEAEFDSLVGAVLGPCRLEALVGRGGMGRVYRARHLALDRLVAVKLVDQWGDAALNAAVLAEARAAEKLEDPRIVAVYAEGEAEGLPYIVVQWVDGESLAARALRRGPLPAREALRIMRETATALSAAHAAGFVHGDVKPANILLDVRGAVKLADFGIARAVASVRGVDGALYGSYHFMAPEQALAGPAGQRADLYALGATWYFALAGREPFPGSGQDALRRHLSETLPDMLGLRPDVGEETAALIRRLLAKNPAERPRSADAVLGDMALIGMLPEADAPGAPLIIVPPPPAHADPADPAAPPAREAPSAEAASAPATVPEKRAWPAPPPPPPAVVPVLGSREAFLFAFASLGLAIVGALWRKAGSEDWLAGAGLLAAYPGLLTLGERLAGWRKAAGALLWLGALACFWRVVGTSPAAPPLEALIAAGLGAVCSAGALALGLWGMHLEEVGWARFLAPLGGALLVVGGLTWTAPEGRGWLAALAAAAPRAGRAWLAAGGAWRWGGLTALVAAAATRRGAAVSSAPVGRNLNWNK